MTDVRDINEIIQVNESVKKVVGISHKVYIIALNAMFMARKTDGTASGFGSVTTELRGFSDRLDSHMSGLAEGIYELVGSVAEQLKQQRNQMYLSRTKSAVSDARTIVMINEASDRHRAEQERISAEFSALRRKVRMDLEKASKLCDMGENLAVLAKIESTGAGSLSSSLKQVSEQIGVTVAEIQQVLREAISCLEERGNHSYSFAQEAIAG